MAELPIDAILDKIDGSLLFRSAVSPKDENMILLGSS
jgi:hypothetical protein